MASLSQGRTAAGQCGLFTHKSVPVIFELPCKYSRLTKKEPVIVVECLLEYTVHLNKTVCESRIALYLYI